MAKELTHEQQKGNVLKEYDGMKDLNSIDPNLREDLFTSRFKRKLGCNYDEANKMAQTAMMTVDMLANREFNFASAAKAAKVYFQPDDVQETA